MEPYCCNMCVRLGIVLFEFIRPPLKTASSTWLHVFASTVFQSDVLLPVFVSERLSLYGMLSFTHTHHINMLPVLIIFPVFHCHSLPLKNAAITFELTHILMNFRVCVFSKS